MKERPPRVAILTTSYPRFSGDEASVFVGRMVEAFSAHGLSGSVIVPFDQDEPEIEQQRAFQIVRYKYGLFSRGSLAFGSGIVPNLRANPLRIFQAPLLLARMAFEGWKKRSEVDLFHANWAVSGLAARYASALSGKKYVITLRGEDARLLKKSIFQLLLGGTLRKAAAITSVNESFLKLMQHNFGIPEERLHFIPNGVDLPVITDEAFSKFTDQIGVPPSRRVMLFVGSVIPRKKVENLIALLAEEPDNTVLVACGRQTDPEYFDGLQQIAEQSGCSDRVLFTGAISPEEVPLYLRLASVYVTASEHEGRSNSVLEALAAGVPVIASDIPGHRELIEHEKNGLLFPVGSTEALLSNYRRLCEDPDLQDSLRNAASESVAALTWEKTAKQYRDLFVGCVG